MYVLLQCVFSKVSWNPSLQSLTDKWSGFSLCRPSKSHWSPCIQSCHTGNSYWIKLLFAAAHGDTAMIHLAHHLQWNSSGEEGSGNLSQWEPGWAGHGSGMGHWHRCVTALDTEHRVMASGGACSPFPSEWLLNKVRFCKLEDQAEKLIFGWIT